MAAPLSGATVYSKSYDDPAYRQPDPLPFPATTAGSGNLTQKFVCFTGRQLKSVTVVPVTAGTSADVLQLIVVTSGPVNLVGSNGSSLFSATGTTTLTYLNLGTIGSGATAAAYFNISQGTFNIQTVNGTTTATATAAVIGSGIAAGGQTLNAGDQFWLKKGTDATVVYIGEFESFFTPGTSFTL
jgi:hypothetical protein